jgi:hypothetical protein
MTTGAPTLGKFILSIFLWMPPCFAAWYFSAPYHAVVTGGLARILVDQLRPGIVSGVERSGPDLAFVTTLEVHPAPGQTAVVVPEVSPLVYTYGLALFLALMLAARAPLWKLLAGAVVLLPFQAWGIAFDFLAQVGGRLGPDVAALAGLSGWRLEGVALGYQVGSLIFPSLVPVMLWAAFSRRAIEGIVRSGSVWPALGNPT